MRYVLATKWWLKKQNGGVLGANMAAEPPRRQTKWPRVHEKYTTQDSAKQRETTKAHQAYYKERKEQKMKRRLVLIQIC